MKQRDNNVPAPGLDVIPPAWGGEHGAMLFGEGQLCDTNLLNVVISPTQSVVFFSRLLTKAHGLERKVEQNNPGEGGTA